MAHRPSSRTITTADMSRIHAADNTRAALNKAEAWMTEVLERVRGERDNSHDLPLDETVEMALSELREAISEFARSQRTG